MKLNCDSWRDQLIEEGRGREYVGEEAGKQGPAGERDAKRVERRKIGLVSWGDSTEGNKRKNEQSKSYIFSILDFL